MRIQGKLIDFLARKRLANCCCDFALVSFYGLKHLQLYSSEVVLNSTNIKVSLMKLAFFYFTQKLYSDIFIVLKCNSFCLKTS